MRTLNLLLLLVLSILLCNQHGKSSRILHGGETLKEKGIPIHSLIKRGPVPPSGSSGCTHIPGTGGNGCPINGKYFAGGAQPRRRLQRFPVVWPLKNN